MKVISELEAYKWGFTRNRDSILILYRMSLNDHNWKCKIMTKLLRLFVKIGVLHNLKGYCKD